MQQIIIKITAFILLFFSYFVWAEHTDNSISPGTNVEFSGFGTLGAVYSDSNIYGYRKDVSSDEGVFSNAIDFKNNSLLGLHVDARLTDDIELVGQTIIRALTAPSFDRYITLAFLRYDASPHWSFRIGRTAPDLFMLTEFRDVDFSYTWATAPNEVYGVIPYRSIDGIDVTYTTRINNGTFQTKLFAGISDAEIASSTLTEVIKLNNFIGLSFSFDYLNWSINAKHSAATIANEALSSQTLINYWDQIPDFIWPDASAISEQLILKNKVVKYTSVSGQYLLNNWLLSAEMSRVDSKSRVIPKITSGYVGLSYQFNQHSFYGVFSTTHSDNFKLDDSAINFALVGELVNATNSVLNFYASNQSTFSLGWRCDINATIATSLQWNNTQIKDNGATLWINRSVDSPAESVNTLMFNLSFIF